MCARVRSAKISSEVIYRSNSGKAPYQGKPVAHWSLYRRPAAKAKKGNRSGTPAISRSHFVRGTANIFSVAEDRAPFCLDDHSTATELPVTVPHQSFCEAPICPSGNPKGSETGSASLVCHRDQEVRNPIFEVVHHPRSHIPTATCCVEGPFQSRCIWHFP